MQYLSLEKFGNLGAALWARQGCICPPAVLALASRLTCEDITLSYGSAPHRNNEHVMGTTVQGLQMKVGSVQKKAAAKWPNTISCLRVCREGTTAQCAAEWVIWQINITSHRLQSYAFLQPARLLSFVWLRNFSGRV